MQLATFDWVIIILYLIGMIGLSIYLSRGQKSKDDYYLGGNDTGAWLLLQSLPWQHSAPQVQF